jgi:hypothetical protein
MIGGNQEGNVANGLWCGAGGNFDGLILMRHVTKKEVEVSAVELWCMWERLGGIRDLRERNLWMERFFRGIKSCAVVSPSIHDGLCVANKEV